MAGSLKSSKHVETVVEREVFSLLVSESTVDEMGEGKVALSAPLTCSYPPSCKRGLNPSGHAFWVFDSIPTNAASDFDVHSNARQP